MEGFSKEELEMINCIWELIGFRCDEYEALETYIEMVENYWM